MPNLEVLELQGGKDPNHLFGEPSDVPCSTVGKLGRLKFAKKTPQVLLTQGFDERHIISTFVKV